MTFLKTNIQNLETLRFCFLNIGNEPRYVKTSAKLVVMNSKEKECLAHPYFILQKGFLIWMESDMEDMYNIIMKLNRFEFS